ncbi:MAG: hypothetical protein IKN98_07370 [Bacteroidales bacterium]|nr:hypothetical protein [Bacteroidales bacterium]
MLQVFAAKIHVFLIQITKNQKKDEKIFSPDKPSIRGVKNTRGKTAAYAVF